MSRGHGIAEHVSVQLHAAKEYPGERYVQVRYYNSDEDREWSQTTFTAGALVLYQPPEEWTEEDWQIHDERSRTLPQGPMATHLTRANAVAYAFLDGAESYLSRLHSTGWLACQAMCSSPYTCPDYGRATRLLTPSYARLRDYLEHEEGVHPTAARIVALHFTKPLPRLR